MMLPILRSQSLCLLVLSLAAFVRPFSPASITSSFSRRSVTSSSPSSSSSTSTTLRMAVDYNNPDVAAEFSKVQFMDYDDVVKELRGKGAAVSASMNDMEVKLMLVEMRMLLSGKMGGKDPKKRPAKFSNKFEEALWTKPAFAELFDDLKAKGDHNAQNVITEYMNDPAVGRMRYGKTYKGLLRKVDESLTAPPPVKSATLKFSGFPSNMGEAALRMTLEALGPVEAFSCVMDDDFPILRGQVTYGDIETARKAVAQYAGMNMGMGQSIEMVSV